MSRKLIIATCQFPVNSDILGNLEYIKNQISEAASQSADIVHFSESCLTGYPGIDFKGFSNSNEPLLERVMNELKSLAVKKGIWLIVGAHYYENSNQKPYNSLFVINDSGEDETRYDKRFLAGVDGGMDHVHYSRGNKPVLFNIRGISCGLLICHEWRYPEAYRQYKQLGADIIFQSWYDGGLKVAGYKKSGEELGELIVGTARGNAANNYMWISGSNTCREESCFSSFLLQPDGKIHRKLKRNQTDILVNEIDFDLKFVDPSGHLRDQVNKLL